MPETRASEVAELVKSALEREPREWPAFLDEACGADAGLRAEVESLLGFETAARRFIEQPAVELASESLCDDASFQVGERVGQYEIHSLIGSGGMGEVYLAQDTELGRPVALKFIKRGFGSQNFIRHFRAEEKILAGLNHPNIAQLHGAGVTADGTLYFVMEYVGGERLDKFCDEQSLGVPDRLQLFRKVCSAVAYAHQNLVIHRDLKPANIRMTTGGEPKLLDFGIAKLLDEETHSMPEQTVTLAGVMTPEYASPEQVRGERMTTASDVYSLGVVLYELLSGRKPYHLATRRLDEISRAVTTQIPPPPSRAITSRAGQLPPPREPIDLRRAKLLRGDLDNIVMMAIRKEPERRYASVGQFSEDIRRHLDRLPVIARKDTAGYRASKFIQRNRLAVAAAVVILLSLLGGILATTREAHRAQRRFDEVRRLANSLMFEIHDSVKDLQGSTPTRRLIVTRALEYLDSLAQEAGGNSTLQHELATAYEKVGDIQGNPYSANLGDTDGALASYRKALAIRERFAGRKSSVETEMELGRSFRGLGDIFEQKGDVAESIENYRRSLAIFEQLATAKPNDPAVQDELARAFESLGDGLGRTDRKDERVACYRKNLEIRKRLLAQKPTDAKMRRSTAITYLKLGSAPIDDKTDALENLKIATGLLEALAREDPDNASARRAVGMAYYYTGTVLTEAGEYRDAFEARRKALAIRQEIATQDPTNKRARFDLAAGHGDLSEAYNLIASSGEAFGEAEQSRSILTELTASDPTNAVYQRNLGLCYERLADAKAHAGGDEGSAVPARAKAWEEARTWYGKALDLFSDLERRKTLMPADARKTAKFAGRIADCEKAIAALEP